jgi:hypothetical protein
MQCCLCHRNPNFENEDNDWVTVMVGKVPKKLCRSCAYRIAKRVIDEF